MQLGLTLLRWSQFMLHSLKVVFADHDIQYCKVRIAWRFLFTFRKLKELKERQQKTEDPI